MERAFRYIRVNPGCSILAAAGDGGRGGLRAVNRLIGEGMIVNVSEPGKNGALVTTLWGEGVMGRFA